MCADAVVEFVEKLTSSFKIQFHSQSEFLAEFS